MSIEIYYFTGTGNSLAVARDIAQRTGAHLLSMPSVMHRQSIAVDAEVVGIVFPVYHGSIPLIVKRFVERIETLDDKYVFAVCTYADSPGLAIAYLGDLVQSRGGQLAAGFAVQMPYNYVTPSLTLKGFFGSYTLREIPVERQQALFAAAQARAQSIAAYVAAAKSGTFEKAADLVTRLVETLNLKETLGKTVWLRIAGVDEPTELSFLESRQLMDRAFLADEKCNGCGICARICPVGNVELVGDRPTWLHRCEQCFACLQWCPREALQFGAKTAGNKRYHHPDVKLADVLKASGRMGRGEGEQGE